MSALRARAAVGLGLAALACARPPTTAPAPATASHLPPVPTVRGPLALKVVYPRAGAILMARDSSFLLGSAGAGDAKLTINGAPVEVWPNGAWLAWVPLPADSLMQFRLVARTPRDSAELVYEVRRSPHFAPPDSSVWIDSTSLVPRGHVWLGAAKYLTLSARAAEAALVRLRLGDGTVVPLAADPRGPEVPAAVRAFDRDTLKLRAPVHSDYYSGVLRGRRVGADPGPILPATGPAFQAALQRTAATCPPNSACPFAVPDVWRSSADTGPVLEAIRGADTARVRWPLELALTDTLPLIVELYPAQPQSGEGIVVGRAAPRASYHWFFPSGTRAVVAGRQNEQVQLELSQGVEAWVAAADVRALPAGTPVPRAIVGSITVSGTTSDLASVRIPLGTRIPFRVDESDDRLLVTLYGASGDASWIRYRSADRVVRRIGWRQEAGDRVGLDIELAAPLWGYRTRWSGTDLLLDVRRSPPIRRGRPLEGRLIVVDPGHPPLGATGPTGLYEAEANLAVAERLRAMLVAAGARVVMTRTGPAPVELGARVRLADSLNAELLISIHNNALPDGVNPFTNNGTSVFYNQPRSLPLARAIQRALVGRLGLRDLGVGRGDLALARPTWMPAVLCEGLFMALPDQEAALRSREGQELYAKGVFDGITEYLKNVNGER
jgi:N-acetylmuramoyl-L-alanine amidase